MPRADQYDDTTVKGETPAKEGSAPADNLPPSPAFADKTPGSHWHATDNTATSKKKGRR